MDRRKPLNSALAHKEPAAPTPAESSLPNGPAAAAILAAGIGCFLLGVFAVVADASKPVARFFTFYVPTGPLSGVTTTAIFLWLVAWIVLARIWRLRTVALAKVNVAAFALLLLGILLTFPPFADLLLRK
jgi:fluoride ion exporter CrcB/FEX